MYSMFTNNFHQTLSGFFSNNQKPIGLHEPFFSGNEWKYVKECIDTGWVSSVGKFVDQFERDLEVFTGVKKAIACVNGTAALQICLQLSGVGANDEVLLPALTFVATANAVSYRGAVQHFVECERESLGVDAVKLDEYLNQISRVEHDSCYNKFTGRKIGALIVVHVFGHPADMDALLAVAQKYNIPVIEDAAESLGSFYKGRHTGNFGVMSALSFNGNKILTTGGGGAILTNDEELGLKAKHLTTTAKLPHSWRFDHDQVGYNFRLPNINAALGVAQLEQLPGFLERKRNLMCQYRELFSGMKGASFHEEPVYAKSNCWLNAVLLDSDQINYRDEILDCCNQNKIALRPLWTLMHKLPMYLDRPRMELSVAEDLTNRCINLPSSVVLAN